MNIDLEALRNNQQEHDFFNHYPDLTPNPTFKDKSCILCYPATQIPENWNKFWLWYIQQGAQSCSRLTQNYFNEAQDTADPTRRKHWIYRLICATRFYTTPDSVEILSREIIYQILNNFEDLDSESVHTQEIYFFFSGESQTASEHISETESEAQSELIEDSDQNLFEDFPDLSQEFRQLYHQENHFDQAFNLLDLDQALHFLFLPMAMDQLQQNLAATLTALNHTLTRSHVIPLPTFHGGSHEDPVKWYEEVERTSLSNAYANDYKQQIIGAFLKDGAATWYDGVRAGIQSWDQNNANSFKTLFMNQYRTQNKIVQWRYELEKRNQLPGETVEQFAKEIKSMIKKIDPDNGWGEAQKTYAFTKGLNDDIYEKLSPVLAAQGNLTLQQAINIAQRVEDDSKHRMLRHPFLQPTAPVLAVPNTQITPDIAKIIADSVKLAVESAFAERRVRFNQGQNNDGQRQNRGPPTCFTCKQIGHISRFCPTLVQTSQKPLDQPKTTQSLVATAEELGEMAFPNEWSLNY